MREKLDTWQINNLITGKPLGAEVSAGSEEDRAFLSVIAYSIDPERRGNVSQFLNADHSDMRFRIRVVEIERTRIDLPDADHFEREITYEEGIENVEELERALTAYLDDFSKLVQPWNLDY